MPSKLWNMYRYFKQVSDGRRDKYCWPCWYTSNSFVFVIIFFFSLLSFLFFFYKFFLLLRFFATNDKIIANNEISMNSQCTKCDANFFLNNGNCVTSSNCPATTYANTATSPKTCTSCDSTAFDGDENCASCTLQKKKKKFFFY